MMKENAAKRNVAVDIDKVVSLYNRKTEIQFELDTLRQKRNENAAKMKGKMEQAERNALIDEGKNIKAKIASLEEEEKKVGESAISWQWSIWIRWAYVSGHTICPTSCRAVRNNVWP